MINKVDIKKFPTRKVDRTAEDGWIFVLGTDGAVPIFRLQPHYIAGGVSICAKDLTSAAPGVFFSVENANLRTCVLKKPPLVRSMTCWYTDCGGWFITTVPFSSREKCQCLS